MVSINVTDRYYTELFFSYGKRINEGKKNVSRSTKAAIMILAKIINPRCITSLTQLVREKRKNIKINGDKHKMFVTMETMPFTAK